ncbi:cobalamin biosynthesis protein [Bacillus thuringiensis]|uniref:Cobalamin biosynthesis protein n=1 Tax=Bacillus thuringiensis TaxID=1428 RepID=A0A9X7BWU9_BACTU|nr:helix-turn-helix domain-containing protein [Bacillus thuringiensis]PGH81061.1 cobalamin biosynthesis protein [Bacillus thuringiensis]
MRMVAGKVRMMCLQERYCDRCKYKPYLSSNCKEECEIGRELAVLDKKKCKGRLLRRRPLEKKWDEKCKQAMILFDQGMEYPDIAKQVGCHVSTLYKELQKRQLLKLPERLE